MAEICFQIIWGHGKEGGGEETDGIKLAKSWSLWRMGDNYMGFITHFCMFYEVFFKEERKTLYIDLEIFL